MAEHVDVTGAANSGDPAPDNIQSQHIRRLEKDLWTAFWGPGVALANIDAGNEQQRGEGWNQGSTDAPSMGVVSGNPAAYNDPTGVTASDPADVNPASPVDFARGDAHDPTASSVNRDHLNAIIRRVNESISRTGHSTGGTFANIVRKDEVTDWGALRGSNLPNPPGGSETASVEVGLADDQSRVRDDHFNTLSDEIEYIRDNAGPPGRWNYGNYSDATVGAWTHENKKTAEETISWGSDYWAQSATTPWPWSASGGTNYYKNLPFSEVRYKFDNWNTFRYWFNQGGNLTVTPYHGSGSSGFATWHAIASGKHLLGVTKPSEDDGDKSGTNVSLLDSGSLHNLGYSGTGNFRVTGTVNRIWALPEQANYCSVGSSGYYHFGNCPTGIHTDETACNADTTSRGHISGTNWRTTAVPMVTVQGSTFNTAYGEHDVFSIGDHYEAEIESVNANVATLKRKPRNSFNQEASDITNGTWVMSRWFRAMALKGDAALYGGSRSEGDPEGYVFMDWRIVHSLTDTDHSIIVRCSYDNSMSAMNMASATIRMYYGIRKPNSMFQFNAEGTPAVYVNFSTDEDDSDERERITMS
tara:strand:+ start:822 stop:2576 length:1755 start_codon:yes stop_codon:yes gene_type:complete